ncbi:MAG: SpoIIIAH-like family protein [Oscillospiraceae bacterium]|nr:SpoIIIAH-like family protein [Oscillospiraceae bacterium]
MAGKKRYLVLTGLVVALGLAVYANWQMSPETKSLKPGSENVASEASKNLGDAQFVNAGNTESAIETQSANAEASADDYFASARLSRQSSRDEAGDTIKEILNKASLTEADKSEAVKKSVELAANIDNENKIESLIKAKGFKDCLAIINGEQVTVVVKSEGLLANEVSMIKDIIVNQTKIPAGNIKIIESK